ncbi:hypothetical protein JTE90_029425, partial [Oedothorax gibbosus]
AQKIQILSKSSPGDVLSFASEESISMRLYPGMSMITGLCYAADLSIANFTWKFNNSVESMDVLSFSSEESISIATYIPRTEYDYGTLLCWGKNSVGVQKDPCVFIVIPAADPPKASSAWKFNNSVESMSMDVLSFASEESISIATYIPRTEYDYGTLLCLGKTLFCFCLTLTQSLT